MSRSLNENDVVFNHNESVPIARNDDQNESGVEGNFDLVAEIDDPVPR